MAREQIDWMSVRISLWMRSGGRCEFCRDPLRNSAEVHHRKLRSQGGGHGEENLALVHPDCHRWAHMNPTMAYDWGWLVSGWGDPAEVPIRTGKPWAN
jgi:5-methylcytosine-specific restriction endonuclease McrA